MLYALRDPRDVEYERAMKHFGNVQRRMREILRKWLDLLLDQLDPGAGCSVDQLAWNCMSSYQTIKMLLNVVVPLHFASETWIFINNVFTAQRRTPTLAITLPTSIATTNKE